MPNMMAVTTQIDYLKRLELYKGEKPYMTTFEIPESIGSTTNHQYQSHEAEIRDARDTKDVFSLHVHGFEFHDWPTVLQGEDFEDEEKIKSLYYPEIQRQLSRLFPSAFKIHILTHLRRRRMESTQQDFDHVPSNGRSVSNTIPYAHTDFSPRGAQVAIGRLLAENEQLRGRRFEIVNAWRVTRGPNRDWPLALCDYNSLDIGDVEMSDVIHKEKVGESTRLYYSSQHQWFYLNDQEMTEVVVFRNVDSRGLHIPFAMHLSFPNPQFFPTPGLARRESIETRFVIFH